METLCQDVSIIAVDVDTFPHGTLNKTPEKVSTSQEKLLYSLCVCVTPFKGSAPATAEGRSLAPARRRSLGGACVGARAA